MRFELLFIQVQNVQYFQWSKVKRNKIKIFNGKKMKITEIHRVDFWLTIKFEITCALCLRCNAIVQMNWITKIVTNHLSFILASIMVNEAKKCDDDDNNSKNIHIDRDQSHQFSSKVHFLVQCSFWWIYTFFVLNFI